MKENKAGQQEAFLRTTNRLPFDVRDKKQDKKIIGRVISEVLFTAGQKKGNGKVIFPEPLSLRQQQDLRQRLDKHHSGFATQRIEFITIVPLEEGTGTLIGIRKK